MSKHEDLIAELEAAKQELKADGNRAVYSVVDKAIQVIKSVDN